MTFTSIHFSDLSAAYRARPELFFRSPPTWREVGATLTVLDKRINGHP